MIEINCSCGAHFEVINEQVAQRARCPRCGARASDILAQADRPAPRRNGALESREPQFEVACVHHPDQPATHNCMNCGKPLCMTCVRESGYYCSNECRTAVGSAEPSAVTDTTPTVGDDEKFERVVAIIFSTLKRVAQLRRRLRRRLRRLRRLPAILGSSSSRHRQFRDPVRALSIQCPTIGFHPHTCAGRRRAEPRQHDHAAETMEGRPPLAGRTSFCPIRPPTPPRPRCTVMRANSATH